MVMLGEEFKLAASPVPEDLEPPAPDPSVMLLQEIRGYLAALPGLIEQLAQPAPAPYVHVAEPDLSAIVTAVNGLKPGATAADIGREIARQINPQPATPDTVMLDAFRELVEKIDFRLQGVGRAFGASGPSNISDNPSRQLGVVSISGTSSAKPIDFSTTVAVTNTAVNLASHALTNGCIVQALLANTATSIKVGFTGSPTFELQPGQATSCAVPDTADIWIDGTAGDGVCVLGS